MKTNKRIFIISVAIVAVIALTLGVAYAAWDNSTAKDDYVVAIGSNADMTVKWKKNADGKLLVPNGQIGLDIAGTQKVNVKTLADDITITLNDDAEGADLVVVYKISAIYSVPVNSAISLADIKKMDADALKTAGIVDLNENYVDTTDDGAKIDNPRYVTGDTTIAKTAPIGTDLRINLVDGTANKNYKVGDEIPFDLATSTPTTANLTLSMEFTRNATEEFVTVNDFLNKKIMIEITFTLETKTSTPAPTPST